MNEIKVSVVMPVYNEKKYVAFAIESILNQTFPNFQFIIVDDGSSDGSKNVIKSFDDSRIKLIENARNLGVGHSLYKCLDTGTSEYIARMDADDIAHPNRLQAQVDFLNTNPDKIVVGSNMYLIDPSNRIISKKDFEKQPRLDTDSILARGVPTPHPSVMMRRHAVEQIGGYRPVFRYAQDLDLWLRLAEVFNEDSLYNLPTRFIFYRIDGQQLLNQTSDNNVFAKVARDAARLRRSGQGELRALNRLEQSGPKHLEEQSPEIQAAYEQYSQFRQHYMARNYFAALTNLAKTEPNLTSIRTTIRLLIRDMRIKFSR